MTAPPTGRPVPTAREPADGLPGYHVYRPVDLDGGGPWPVIVWANGACIRYDEPWRTLLERCAGAGFVVVAITTRPGEEPSLTDRSTVDDQAAAIDWAEAQHHGSGPLAGRLDLGRIAAAGNSCGGITSLALAGRDARVRAVFVLSGSSVGPDASPEEAAAVMAKVRVPVGFVVGGPTDIAGPQADQDLDLLADGIPGFVAHRSSGDHHTVSTDVGVLAESAEFALHWLDFVLFGNPAAREALVAGPCPVGAPGLYTVRRKGFT